MNAGLDLSRFLQAQEGVYPTALAELQAGAKVSHWMWFIFPQLRGLGRSATALHYGLQDAVEARAYIADPVLGPRLLECCRALLAHQGASAVDILGHIDALKLRSCATLFGRVSPAPEFADILSRFYGGVPDAVTLDLLERE